jgi:hypothetical protein
MEAGTMADTTKIDVTLDIYKLIEQNRISLEEPHYQILRRMLGLPLPKEKPLSEAKYYLGEGVYVPYGTLFRRVYKGKEHIAEVKYDGIWLNGKKHPTINKAVNAISNSPQNAWKFWQVKRPQDSKWIPLNNLRNLTDADLAEFD